MDTNDSEERIVAFISTTRRIRYTEKKEVEINIKHQCS